MCKWDTEICTIVSHKHILLVSINKNGARCAHELKMLEIGFSRFTRNLLQRTYRLVANNILEEYNLPTGDTPVTTDRESNIVAALRNSVRVDCACHRLHVSEIIVERHEEQVTDAASYETAVSDLCRYVKQATAIQE